IDPVFIWQTDPTWFNPSAQQERNTVMSSTCCAICGYQSDTQMPLCPCCFHWRWVPISVLLLVPIAVMTLPNDVGMGWPASLCNSGLGSKRSRWLGPPSMKSQITDFAVGLWCGCFGASGSAGVAPCSIDDTAKAPRPPQARISHSRRETFSIECGALITLI